MPVDDIDLFSARAAAARERNLYSPAELFLESAKLRRHQAAQRAARLRHVFGGPDRRFLAHTAKCYPSAEHTPLPRLDTRFPCTPARTVTQPGARGRLDVATLAQLLGWAYGRAPASAPGVRSSEHVGRAARARPTVPSVAGLYPLELYVRADDVAGLGDGTYHYEVASHRLERVVPAEPYGRPWTGRGTFVVICGVPARATYALGERGVRLMLTEAGRVAQSCLLLGREAAVEVEEQWLWVDDDVHATLGLDGVDEIALMMLAVRPAVGGGR